MAEHEQEIFKQDLAGSIVKRIFKAELKRKAMILDPELKLIIPIQTFTDLDSFTKTLESFIHMEWSHTRRRNGTLEYKNVPVFDKISESSFYLWNGWTIYHKYRNRMRCAGWIESNNAHSMTAVYNYFRPLGMYAKGSYIEITYKDGRVEKFELPEYDEDAESDNGLLINTLGARSIIYSYPAQTLYGTEHDKKSIPGLVGCPIEKISTAGNKVSFPATL